MERYVIEARLSALRCALRSLAEILPREQFHVAVIDALVDLETRVQPLDLAWFRAESQGVVQSARWLLRTTPTASAVSRRRTAQPSVQAVGDSASAA